MICNKAMARTICSKVASTVRKGRDLNWGSCLTTSNRQLWEKNPKYKKNWRSRILVLLLSKHHSRGLFTIKRWGIFEKKKKTFSRAYCRQTAWTKIFSIYSLESETLKVVLTLTISKIPTHWSVKLSNCNWTSISIRKYVLNS